MTIGTYILISVIKIVIALFVLLTGVAYTTLAERKIVAHIQNRWGPSRVGPFGIWQPLADGLKFIFKEDITPPFAYKPLYHGGWCLHAAADRGRQHRALDHPRTDLNWGLWSSARRMVVKQQVLDAG